MSPVSAVQCSAVLSSIVHVSPAVGRFTNHPKNGKQKKKNHRHGKKEKKCVITGQNKQYAICQKHFSTSGSVGLATVWTHKQTHAQTDMATL